MVVEGNDNIYLSVICKNGCKNSVSNMCPLEDKLVVFQNILCSFPILGSILQCIRYWEVILQVASLARLW
jgi:hypothetical protein